MALIIHLDPEDIARAEALAEAAPIMPEDVADPERFVPEAEWNAATDADHADVERIRDWEQFEGFHA